MAVGRPVLQDALARHAGGRPRARAVQRSARETGARRAPGRRRDSGQRQHEVGSAGQGHRGGSRLGAGRAVALRGNGSQYSRSCRRE